MSDLKILVKRVPKQKLLKLMKGRGFESDPKVILYQARTCPEKYFTIDELRKYSKKKSKKKSKKRSKKRKTSRGGCGIKGGGKKSPFMKQYTKISKIDCAKKNPKSREKTLKCLDDKKEQFKSLEKSSPKDMKELEKLKKEYNKSLKKMITNSKKCMKYHGDKTKFKKCVEHEAKELKKYDNDNSKIFVDEMRDNLQRMVDHTQKVDFGVFGDLKSK